MDACGFCAGGTTNRNACVAATLNPVADTWVNSQSADSNYGTDGTMQVKASGYDPEGRLLLKFDLSSLPANAVIRSATLTATASVGYAYGGDGNVYSYFVSDDSWTETGVTWNNQPSALTTSNLGYWWIWDDYTVHDMVGTYTTPALAAQVQTELAGDKTLSLMLGSPGYDTTYYTREGDSTKQAALSITYDLPQTTTLSVAADTWVNSQSADSNYGNDSSMQVKSSGYDPEGRLLLKFDLSSLPANAVIRSATLTATASVGYAYGGDGNVYSYFVSDDSWTETGVTWNNQPSALTTSNLGYWWIWDDYTVHDMVGSYSTPALAAQVQTELAGDKTLSLMLGSPGYDTTYYTREGDPSKAATLAIDYFVPLASTPVIASADTWVNSQSPDSNYGTDATMQVKSSGYDPEGRLLLKFDLSALPANAVVSAATLTATASVGYAYGGDGNVYSYFVSDDSWTETGVTWNNQPSALTTSNLGYWWIWDDYTVHDMVGSYSTPALAAQVQAEITGDKTLSLMLGSPGYDTTYYTRETADDTKKATLTVTYY